jgi:putative transposase
MPQYRRVRLKGGVFFFTVVTHERRRILTSDLGIQCLRRAWRTTHETMPFETEAVCVLPDHIHVMWSLPEGDDDYSARWRKLKGLFTREFRRRGGSEGTGSESRQSKGEAAVWQRRFWEHRIRDVDDFRRHVEYVHFNPVKHGYVTRLEDWKWSSFHDHVARGWIEPDWGTIEPEGIVNLDAGE